MRLAPSLHLADQASLAKINGIRIENEATVGSDIRNRACDPVLRHEAIDPAQSAPPHV
jgi:hypothetical protein